MSEANHSADVKRGDHRDMRSPRSAGVGSAKKTLRPAPPDFGGVAARNETSVLFTVDSLRCAACVKAPAPAAPPSSAFIASDDDGVIDLRALASTPPQTCARSVAPLFSDPAPAALTSDLAPGTTKDVLMMPGSFTLGKRTLAGIAAAGMALALCTVGLAAAFKGAGPVARTSAMMDALPTPAAPVLSTSAAPAQIPVTTASAPSAVDSVTDDGAKAAAATTKGKKAKKSKTSPSGTKVQSSDLSTSKGKRDPLVSRPAPKAPDTCGCKGDFNCILRCTAKGR